MLVEDMEPSSLVDIPSEDVELIDVREEDEFTQLSIVGAKSCPLSSFEEDESTIDDSKEYIVFYCRSGKRSLTIAYDYLSRFPHLIHRVYNLKGGILAWNNLGYPIFSEKNP